MAPTRFLFPILLLLAVNTLNFYDRQVLSALTEPIRATFQLDDRALGILGTAFILLYAVAGIPLGWLCDVAPRKLILAGGVFVWSVLTAAARFAQSYEQLYILRLGVGVGEAACAPAATSLIGDLFPARERGRATSIFMLGLPAGIALSYLVSSRVANAYGWRAAFLVAGLPGIVVAGAALWLREPARGLLDAVPGTKAAPSMRRYTELFRNPTFGLIVASGIFHNFNMYALGIFVASYLVRWHGLDLPSAGNAATAVYGVSGLVGLLGGGYLADLLAQKSAHRRLFAAAGAVLISAPFAYLSLGEERGHWLSFSVLMGVACVFSYVYYPTVYPAIQDLVEPRLRGRAMSLYFFAMYVCGGSLGPFLTGSLSDHYTKAAAARAGVTDTAYAALEPFRAEGLRSALSIVPALSLVLAVVLFAAAIAARRRVQDAR